MKLIVVEYSDAALNLKVGDTLNLKNMMKLKLTISTIIVSTLVFISCKKDNAEYKSQSLLSKSEYISTIRKIKQKTDKILLEYKPDSISLAKYRADLFLGKYSLTQSQKDRILQISRPLAEHGKILAKKNNIRIGENDLNEEFTIATINSQGLGIKSIINDNQPFSTSRRGEDEVDGPVNEDIDVIVNGDLTWGEVGRCAIEAIGVDAGWSLAPSAGTSWTYAALRTSFRNVASRFLGPIGVAIAVVEFSWCLIREGADYTEPIGDDENDLPVPNEDEP